MTTPDYGKSEDLDEFPVSTSSALLSDLENQRPPTTKTRLRSTAYLDGLRGFAALLVMMQHYLPYFYGDGEDINHGFGERGHYNFASFPLVRFFFSGGNAAVAIFFVLSGYVLSQSPLRKLRDGGKIDLALVSATIRRPVRLFLPPLATTLVYALLLQAPFGAIHKMGWPKPEPNLSSQLTDWVIEYTKFFNPFRTFEKNAQWFRYGIVVWTLPIELRGSVLVYSCLFVLGRTSGRSKPIISCAILGIGAILLFALLQWALALFIVGMALSVCDINDLESPLEAFQKRASGIVYPAVFALGIYLVGQPSYLGGPEWALNTPGWVLLTKLTPKSYYEEQYWRFWSSIGAALMVFSVRHLHWLQNVLTTRPLRYLGQVSFAFYLTHPMVIFTFSERLHRALGQVGVKDYEEASWFDNKLWIPDVGPMGLSTRFLVAFAAMLTACLGVAHMGTIFLDRPSIRAGKWVVRRLGLHERT